MNILKYIVYLYLFCSSLPMFAQIFGNTDAPDIGSYGQQTIVWFQIVTGPNDSGTFTHYGIYDHPTAQSTCAIKFSIYDNSTVSATRPSNLLTSDYLAAPVNGVWNEVPLTDPVTILPNTQYWIGLRFPCNYGSSRKAGTIWANQPLRYYDSWSFFSNWPDPVASNPSTFGSVNNVGLYLVGNNQTLPVELLSFDVREEDNTSKLTWEVATELNNAGWNVQRSTNGFSWADIGWVEGKGSTNTKGTYEYTDKYDGYGLVFYRLQQVDLDGTNSYTEVKSVEFRNSSISIYPNPAQNTITLSGVETGTEYKMHDAAGQLLYVGKATDDSMIDISQLKQGMYFLDVDDEILKLLKE